MARSIASRPGASSRSPLTSATSMILPFALTLTTAAIASAGLYFFSDSSTTQPKPYLPSDTEEERPPPQSRRSRKPPRTKAAILRQQDADLASGFSDIPEEDTDAIVESHREEEEWKRQRRTQLGMTFARVKGRVGEVLKTVADEGLYDEEEAAEERRRMEEEERRRKREEMMMEQRREQQEIMLQREREIDPAAIPLPSDSPVGGEEFSGPAEGKTLGQYVPPPKRLKPIVIVVQERKATQGHESDDSFEEALSPTPSLITLLPSPLPLTNATLHILLISPYHIPSSIHTISRSQPPTPSTSTHDLSTHLLQTLSLPLQKHLHIVPTLSALPSIVAEIDPAVVYFEEALAEETIVGEVVRSGVGKVVVVVGGGGVDGLGSDDGGVGGGWGGRGGNEKGMATRRTRGNWGARVQVVEGWCVAEDWGRRVEDMEG